MVKMLARAVAEAESLPEAAQEKIGRELLAHIEKLRGLRRDIEEGVQALDAGGGKELDVESVIRRARGRNAKG